MRPSKIVLSAWLATGAFCLLQILFGPTGLTETLRLKQVQHQLDLRLADLRKDNADLTARYEALRTSGEVVRLEARRLGWFRPGERPVLAPVGTTLALPSDRPNLTPVVVDELDPQALSVFFRLAWPLLFAMFYTALVLWSRLRPEHGGALVVFQGPPGNLPARWLGTLDFFRK